jgi:hypothetical protein
MSLTISPIQMSRLTPYMDTIAASGVDVAFYVTLDYNVSDIMEPNLLPSGTPQSAKANNRRPLSDGTPGLP